MAGVKKGNRAPGALLGMLLGGTAAYSLIFVDQLVAGEKTGDEEIPWFHYTGVELASSDAGSSRQVMESEISRKLDGHKSVYARLRLGREVDPDYVNSLFRRMALGVTYRTASDGEFRAEASGGIDSGKAGYLVSAKVPANERLNLEASYTSFAEDVPMPSIANGIYSNRYVLGSSFHGEGWLYEGAAALKSYEFSDGNLRQVFETSLGYSYDRTPDRWRRLGVSLYYQQNSLASTAYFNPSAASTVSLYHMWEFPRPTRFRSLKDLLTLRAGLSQQEGYQPGSIGELRYERKYALTKHSWMEMGASVASNVYDGNREAETSARFSYSREF